MGWKIEFSPAAIDQLKKLDLSVRRRLFNYLEEHIQGCKNPRHFGGALSSNLSGLWRYRVGDYRILCEIQDEKVIVLVLTIGHRREIYK